MHGKSSIYLDTSVINFLFADDAPEKKEITIDLFDNFIKIGIYQAIISPVVLEEINNTGSLEKRNQLIQVIKEYPIDVMKLSDLDEVEQLADLYLKHKIIPPAKRFDALHIAISVVNKLDYLVSWNYKHLANVNRERKVLALNYQVNYLHPIRIITPLELIDYGI